MDAQKAEAALRQVEEMFPEPLFESAALSGEHLCLVCGQRRAQTALRSSAHSDPIVPLCSDCSGDWKMYGYLILKRIRPAALLAKMTGYFLLNPFRRHVIWRDLRGLRRWQSKMLRLRAAAKGEQAH